MSSIKTIAWSSKGDEENLTQSGSRTSSRNFTVERKQV